MLATALAWLKGSAGGIAIYAAVFAAGGIVTGWAVHAIDHGRYVDLQLADQKAQTAAVELAKAKQHDQDQLAIDSAVAEAGKQAKIAATTAANLLKVKSHVKELTASCITVGLVRVFDAGIYGVDPAVLELAPGESDDTCAGITAASLAESVYSNYSLARANAQQLNDLEAYVVKMVAIAK